MANALYPIYKQNLLAGTAGYDLDNDTVPDGPYCSLVDLGNYTYSPAHQFQSSVPAGAIVGTDQRISAPTVVNGTFDGNNLTYIAVVGNSVEALIVYRHNAGPNSTWPLVMYYDQPGGGLPVTPNGGNITVTWNSAGIFTL